MLSSLLGSGALSAADDPVLKIIAGEKSQTISQSVLTQKMTPVEITVYNPVYQHPMTYQGFWLDEILSTLKIHLSEEDVVFESSDGFGTSLSVDEVGKQKWLVAYGEPQGWSPLPERHVRTTPGPWYVVGRDADSYREFPWPYQVVAIKIRGDW